MKKIKFLTLIIALIIGQSGFAKSVSCVRTTQNSTGWICSFSEVDCPVKPYIAANNFCVNYFRSNKLPTINVFQDGNAVLDDNGKIIKIASDKAVTFFSKNTEHTQKEIEAFLKTDDGIVSQKRIDAIAKDLNATIVKSSTPIKVNYCPACDEETKKSQIQGCPGGYEMKDGWCQKIGIPKKTNVNTAKSIDCPKGYYEINGECVKLPLLPTTTPLDHRAYVCRGHRAAIVTYHYNPWGEVVIDDVIDRGSCGDNFTQHLNFTIKNEGNWTEATEKQYQEINSLVIKKTKIDSAEIISQIKQATGSTATKTIWYNPTKIKSEITSLFTPSKCPWGYEKVNGVCVPKTYGPSHPQGLITWICSKPVKLSNGGVSQSCWGYRGKTCLDVYSQGLETYQPGTICREEAFEVPPKVIVDSKNRVYIKHNGEFIQLISDKAQSYADQNLSSLSKEKIHEDFSKLLSNDNGFISNENIKIISKELNTTIERYNGVFCPPGFVWENGKCVPQLDVPTTPQSISVGGGKCKCGGCSWYGKCKDFDAHNCKSSKLQSNHTMVTNKAFIFIGGGATLPGKSVKTATALPILGNIDINAYVPLVKKKTWSFGLNAGTAFGLSNKFADDACPDPFQVQNQTGSPTVSAKGSGSPKNAGFKFEAGPALMVMIKDKFGIMPILNVSYRYIAQKSFTCTQTSIVNTITYNWDLLSQTQTKNNVVAFDPKLRLLYMFGRVGIWVEGSYSIGSKMKTVSTIFDPEGNAQPDGTYDLGQMNLPTYNTETKSTNFSAFGVHGGIVIGIGKKGTGQQKGGGFKDDVTSSGSTNIQTGGNPLFKCRCCDKEFDNLTLLATHKKTCDKCPTTSTPTTTVGMIKNDPEWDTIIPGGPMFPPSGISIVEETLSCKCCGKDVSGTFGQNIEHIKTCCKKKDAVLMKKMQEEMIAKHKITSTQNMQGGGSWVLYSCVCCKEAFQTEDELFDHKCAKGCFGTTIRNTGTVKGIEVKLLTDGSTTQDGIPIAGTTIHGTITGIKKPAEIKITQVESNDIGIATTDKNGNFTVTVKHDTMHKIYVNGVEYGKIKIISKQENDAFKCDCCGGVYGYDNFLAHAKTCCTKATKKSDYPITYVNAQMVELPNGMGVGTQPTSAITVKKGNKTIQYTDISSKEVNSVTQQPITFLLPSSFTMATNDIKSIGGEQEQSMDWYWKVYKGDNNKIIAVPLSLMLSPTGVDVIGATMRKKKDGDKAAPVCKFNFRNLAVDYPTFQSEIEDDNLPAWVGCGGNLVHAPQPDTTIYLPATDFPTNIMYTSNGTDTRILTKQASKPTMLNSINFCSKYIEGYGLVVYPIDFEISCNDAGVMLKGLFDNSKKINGTPTSSKKHDYVGHVTLMR